MRIEKFVKEAKKHLQPYLGDHGIVLYSNKNTLRSNNDFAFYGYNPGTAPDIAHPIRWTVEQSLDFFQEGFANLREEGDPEVCAYNLIDHQRWPRGGNLGDWHRGWATYQRGVRSLCEGDGTPGAIVTNLFFRQSRYGPDLLAHQDHVRFTAACWEVHKMIFRIAKTKIIIAVRDAVECGLVANLNLTATPIDQTDAEYRGLMVKHWGGRSAENIDVIQVPHLSRYPIYNHVRVLAWIRKKVKEILDQKRNQQARE